MGISYRDNRFLGVPRVGLLVLENKRNRIVTH